MSTHKPRFGLDRSRSFSELPAPHDFPWGTENDPPPPVEGCNGVRSKSQGPTHLRTGNEASNETERPICRTLNRSDEIACPRPLNKLIHIDVLMPLLVEASERESSTQAESHIPDSFAPVTLSSTEQSGREDHPIPSTPASSSDSSSRTPYFAEHTVHRPPACDPRRQFLIPDKRTPPKGFKLIKRKADIVRPNHTPLYPVGDGFSDVETIPTGLVQVAAKRKAPHAAVPLGRLELTQTTSTEPGKKQKTRRFIKTRKKDCKEDDLFDFADVQLTGRVTKRGLRKAPKSPDVPITSLPGRVESPVLGEFEDMDQDQVLHTPHAVGQLLDNASDTFVFTDSPNPQPPDAVETISTVPETQLSGGQMGCSDMRPPTAEVREPYEVSQTPVVLDTQMTKVS